MEFSLKSERQPNISGVKVKLDKFLEQFIRFTFLSLGMQENISMQSGGQSEVPRVKIIYNQIFFKIHTTN